MTIWIGLAIGGGAAVWLACVLRAIAHGRRAETKARLTLVHRLNGTKRGE